MAIEKWATDAAAGGGSGDSILDPYTLVELENFVNGDANTDVIFAYLCGNFTMTQQLHSTVRRNPDKRLIFQGRDLATGSINQLITLDADGNPFTEGAVRIFGGGATNGGNHTYLRQIRVINTGGTTAGFFIRGTVRGTSLAYCEAEDVENGIETNVASTNANHLMYACLADSTRDIAFQMDNGDGHVVECVAKDCNDNTKGCTTQHRCISVNSGGFGFNFNWCKCASHLTSYSAGGSGIEAGGASPQFIAHCFSQEAAGFGIAFPGSGSNYTQEIYRFAGALNVSGRIDTPSAEAPVFDELPITATADCFNDKGAEDFGLNEDLNGGVLLKNIDGIAFPRGTTISYHAAGAVESPQAAGPGGGIPFPGNYTNKGVH